MRNKKKILVLVIAVFVLFGLIFCLVRPTYVSEAVDILFKNELKEENIKVEDGSKPEEKEESGSATSMPSREESGRQPGSSMDSSMEYSQESSQEPLQESSQPSSSVQPVTTLPESSSGN